MELASSEDEAEERVESRIGSNPAGPVTHPLMEGGGVRVGTGWSTRSRRVKGLSSDRGT